MSSERFKETLIQIAVPPRFVEPFDVFKLQK